MNYDDLDKEFVDRVSKALYTRMNINTNKLNGIMIMSGAEPHDHVNPELKLSKDAIKDGTGREKVRDVALEHFQSDFKKKGIDATVVKQDGECFLQLRITPERAKEVKFDSLSSIEKRNNADLDEDPDLGKPYYDY